MKHKPQTRDIEVFNDGFKCYHGTLIPFNVFALSSHSRHTLTNNADILYLHYPQLCDDCLHFLSIQTRQCPSLWVIRDNFFNSLLLDRRILHYYKYDNDYIYWTTVLKYRISIWKRQMHYTNKINTLYCHIK